MSNEFITLKLIEELNELSTILLQQHNKPSKDFINEISMEFGDVKYWMGRYDGTCKLDKKIVQDTYKGKVWKHEKIHM
tara:strand:- start:4524 stop:4757 length:234 start_codon:yes stop_codon:yes gene_type:complete